MKRDKYYIEVEKIDWLAVLGAITIIILFALNLIIMPYIFVVIDMPTIVSCLFYPTFICNLALIGLVMSFYFATVKFTYLKRIPIKVVKNERNM